MSQNESQTSELTDFIVKIQNCLLKALKSAELVVDKAIIENIQQKIQEISNSNSTVATIEHFIFTLINAVETLKQQVHVYQLQQSRDIDKEDYQNLETAVQKAEAEIRKHIRLQQQLKIYMDGLEEKVEQLEKQIKIENNKYHQLFQSMKEIDSQRKQLKKRLKDYEQKPKLIQQRQIRQLSHKTSKILSQPTAQDHDGSSYGMYKMYNERSKITKSKNFVQRSLNFKQSDNIHQQKQKKDLEKLIDVSLKQSPSIKKRNETEKTQIKQLTRTIQLKQNYRKPSRKLIKYSTQQKSGLIMHKKGEVRCNSICH